MDFYEKDFFIGLIWKDDHYQVVGKYGLLYVLVDPSFDFPIRHTYREFLEYITSPGVLYFHVEDEIDEEYHLDWYLETPVFGAGRRKKRKKSSDDKRPTKKVRKVAGVRRSVRRTRNTTESVPNMTSNSTEEIKSQETEDPLSFLSDTIGDDETNSINNEMSQSVEEHDDPDKLIDELLDGLCEDDDDRSPFLSLLQNSEKEEDEEEDVEIIQKPQTKPKKKGKKR